MIKKAKGLGLDSNGLISSKKKRFESPKFIQKHKSGFKGELGLDVTSELCDVDEKILPNDTE